MIPVDAGSVRAAFNDKGARQKKALFSNVAAATAAFCAATSVRLCPMIVSRMFMIDILTVARHSL
jgi:hypothetical protein